MVSSNLSGIFVKTIRKDQQGIATISKHSTKQYQYTQEIWCDTQQGNVQKEGTMAEHGHGNHLLPINNDFSKNKNVWPDQFVTIFKINF
jgi:hypothetical protein